MTSPPPDKPAEKKLGRTPLVVIAGLVILALLVPAARSYLAGGTRSSPIPSAALWAVFWALPLGIFYAIAHPRMKKWLFWPLFFILILSLTVVRNMLR